jgi:hypothetical protein
VAKRGCSCHTTVTALHAHVGLPRRHPYLTRPPAAASAARNNRRYSWLCAVAFNCATRCA